MNNKTIEVSIQEVKQQVAQQQEQIARTQKFYLNYLSTDYAGYFQGHENGQLYTNERILRLKYRSPEDIPNSDPQSIDFTSITPKDSRKQFLSERLEEFGF